MLPAGAAQDQAGGNAMDPTGRGERHAGRAGHGGVLGGGGLGDFNFFNIVGEAQMETAGDRDGDGGAAPVPLPSLPPFGDIDPRSCGPHNPAAFTSLYRTHCERLFRVAHENNVQHVRGLFGGRRTGPAPRTLTDYGL